MKSFRISLPLGQGFLIVALSFLASACATKHAKVQTNVPMAQGPSLEDLDNEKKIDYQNPPINQEEYEAQQRGEVPPTFDIPIVRNAKVEQWIGYFQGRGRKWFHIYLERSGKYIPFMQKILREHDLPEDLVYLAMIESGFSDRAYSRARAVGPWQFMKATGRIYGLNVNFWVDERRDPEKSTIAAARHLKDLYDQFQSWKLAAAAYNAGAGKVQRAIRRYRTEDFWELARGRYLRPETRHYVPKLIAAALIAKEPAKYGFKEIQYQNPLKYDKIVLEKPVNLVRMAEAAKVDIDELLAFNPELNHPITPPLSKDYELRIPVGTADRMGLAYAQMMESENIQYAAHKVRKGDNLRKIANMYSTSAAEIQKINQLKASTVRTGQILIIPVPLDNRLRAVPRRAGVDEPRKTRKYKQLNSNRRQNTGAARVHVVRRGENLSMIAKRYKTTVNALKKKNNLRQSQINPGRRLVLPQS